MDIDNLLTRNDENLDKISKYLYVGLFALGAYLLVLTLICPVKQGANALLIYSRNAVSIATWWSMAFFFKFFRLIHNSDVHHMKTMKYFTAVCILVALMCLVKIVLSVMNLIHYLNFGSALIPFYYVGELFAWIALAVFFISYSVKIFNRFIRRY